MNLVAAYYLARDLEQKYWTATLSTATWGAARYLYTGNPATLKFAGRMASFGVRAHSNAVLGVLRTPLVRGGASTLGGAAAQGIAAVALGYTAGAVIGTGIAKVAFGDEGAEKALDLYLPGGADFISEGILSIPENAWTIASHYASKAVESDVFDNLYV